MEAPRVPVVAVVDERLQTTSLSLTVGYGARNDPPGLGGVAHLLEHLLMSVPAGGVPSFCEHVERLGGHANALTGPELMQFYAQVHADDADEIAELLLTAVLTPDIGAGHLDAERAVVLQELATGAADPADAVQDGFAAELFAGHELGRPVGGVPAELGAVTVEDVRREHAESFLSAPMTLVVVGPRVPKPLIGAPSEPPGTRLAARTAPVPVRQTAPPVWPAGESLCWVCVGAPSPPAGHPDQPAFTVLAKLLGSSPSSLLYRALRGEEGLAYSFQAWNRGYSDTGLWRLLAGVDPGNAGRLLEVVRELLDGLASEGPSPDDLDAARRQATMSLVCDAEVPLEYANLIGARGYAGTVAWSVRDELACLAAVTTDDVRAAAARVAAGLRVSVRPEAS
ncbi:M16 family metallopeptidase [Lentzea sp. NPDC102401]|uniref:M16 family metallopeptidase n=1 Tax=Lentzea sp. NPDC102401 TaxID=3364128 RepID=UPI003829F2A5